MGKAQFGNSIKGRRKSDNRTVDSLSPKHTRDERRQWTVNTIKRMMAKEAFPPNVPPHILSDFSIILKRTIFSLGVQAYDALWEEEGRRTSRAAFLRLVKAGIKSRLEEELWARNELEAELYLVLDGVAPSSKDAVHEKRQKQFLSTCDKNMPAILNGECLEASNDHPLRTHGSSEKGRGQKEGGRRSQAPALRGDYHGQGYCCRAGGQCLYPLQGGRRGRHQILEMGPDQGLERLCHLLEH